MNDGITRILVFERSDRGRGPSRGVELNLRLLPFKSSAARIRQTKRAQHGNKFQYLSLHV